MIAALYRFFVFFIFVIPYTLGLVIQTDYQKSAWQFFEAYRFLWAFIALVLLAVIFYRKSWAALLGISIDKKQVLYVIITFLLAGMIFRGLIHHAISNTKHVFGSIQSDDFRWWILRIFQALNEEIVLRAVLIAALASVIKNRFLLAAIPAFLFAILHFVFYGFLNQTWLILPSFITLLCFGIIANYLFIRFGHIWYGFALHLAWNLQRFNGDILLGGQKLSEAQTFILIEGSWPTAIASAVGMITCIAFLERKQ